MKTNLTIALRFLLAKKRSMLMSLIGISMGVAFIILTQAITSGFQGLFIHAILSTDGAMRVEDKLVQTMQTKYQPGVAEPRRVAEAIKRFPDVTGVSAVLRGNVVVQSATKEDSGQVFGIDLDDHLAVSDLGNQIVIGSMEDFRNTPSGVIFGSVLANRLGIRPGDSVLISYAGLMTRFRVSAIYETGVGDIDKVRIFMHMDEARLLLRRTSGCTYLQIAVRDMNKAPDIAAQIQLTIGHKTTSWQEREVQWLSIFQFLGIMSFIVVVTIIVVAGLGMFNTLVMIVMEKTREIAILRSMGFTRADIAFVFMAQGALVLVVGVLAGWGIGALATWGVSSVPFRITTIFATSHIPVAWKYAHYIGAAVASLVVVSIASWVPARRAARLEPAAIIRGASQ